MADRLRNGLRWLGAQKKQHESSPVVYRRDDGSAIEGLLATYGRRDVTLLDSQSAVTVNVEAHDFVVDAADLAFEDVRFEPRRGDYIESTINGTREFYDVASPETDGRVWRFTDSTGLRVRIHTFLRRAEQAEESDL